MIDQRLSRVNTVMLTAPRCPQPLPRSLPPSLDSSPSSTRHQPHPITRQSFHTPSIRHHLRSSAGTPTITRHPLPVVSCSSHAHTRHQLTSHPPITSRPSSGTPLFPSASPPTLSLPRPSTLPFDSPSHALPPTPSLPRPPSHALPPTPFDSPSHALPPTSFDSPSPAPRRPSPNTRYLSNHPAFCMVLSPICCHSEPLTGSPAIPACTADFSPLLAFIYQCLN
jgi:hypothetical protein